MEIKYTRCTGIISIIKIREIGERFISELVWDTKNGRATKELIESMIPNSRFIGVLHYSGISPETLGNASWTHVLVEQTFGN